MTNYIKQVVLPDNTTALIQDEEARTSIASMQTQLDGKANTATSIAGYGITDAYTKTEIDNMIGNIETQLSQV